MIRQLIYWLGLAAICGGVLASVGRGQETARAAKPADYWFDDERRALVWSSNEALSGEPADDGPREELAGVPLEPELLPSQFLSPALQNPAARQPVRLAPSTPRPALRAAAVTGWRASPT